MNYNNYLFTAHTRILSGLRESPTFDQSRLDRIEDCCTEKFFQSINSDTGEVLYSKRYIRCKDRMCPYCYFFDRMKARAIIFNIKNSIQSKMLFSTVTLKSVPFKDIKITISKLHKIFSTAMKSKKLKRFVQGYVSLIELPKSSKGKIQVHLHSIVFVSGSLFGRNYVSKDEFADIIKYVGQLDYTPHVVLKKVKDADITKIIKYITKFDNFNSIYTDENLTSQQLIEFSHQIAGCRLVSFSGVCRKKKKLLHDEYKATTHKSIASSNEELKCCCERANRENFNDFFVSKLIKFDGGVIMKFKLLTKRYLFLFDQFCEHVCAFSGFPFPVRKMLFSP